MNTPPQTIPSVQLAQPRKPLVSAALSLLLPGLGLLFVGNVLSAFSVALISVVLPGLWTIGFAALNFKLSTYFWGDKIVGIAIRILAALASFIAAKLSWARPLPAAPVGLYGLFLIGSLVVTIALSKNIQSYVPPPVQLSHAAFGFENGEYIQGRKFGSSAEPAVGALALCVTDPADAGQNPLATIRRDALVGIVTSVVPPGFTIEGLDASVPLEQYLGEPAGVILSRDEKGIRWNRIGAPPLR